MYTEITDLIDGTSPWAIMWTLAVATFAGFKVATGWPCRHRASTVRQLGYLIAWPGMDARSFFRPRGRSLVATADVIAAIGDSALGAALIWIFARNFAPLHLIAAGWCIMIGMVLLLHFGALQAITLLWRGAGFDVPPLMDHPLRSQSLAEFWGRRWNSGFSAAAREMIFAPLSRRIGGLWATSIVFVFSGIIHDIVISMPARGGYGLPTLYFLIQLGGLLLQRAKFARRTGLSGGALGRIYTFVFSAAPLQLLFHGPFVARVIVPFARAVGAF